ncbi:MAG TPA: galactose-1-phosphate uridylyltransferase [Gemmataceae bacterium]|nr:galactose-1-phosphate uridylyltransferase [Gemmataceae bacterium]
MTWEQRWHPLREEWVIVAAHRNHRPWTGETLPDRARGVPEYVADCPLCPGNVRVSGTRNPSYTGIFVFDNDMPCVGPAAPADLEAPPGIYRNSPARGLARVVCYTPRHDLTLAELDLPQIVALLEAWQVQYRELGARPEVNHVLTFENKGEVVGVSNPHPHCQIYATNFVFKTIENEVALCRRYWQERRRALMEDVIAAERADGRRLLAERDSAIAFVPYFARYAYETFVVPRQAHASLADLSAAEVRDLAAVLQEVIVRFDNLWRMSFPYVMALHQAPTDGRQHDGFHFHIEFHPPLRKPNLLKYLAGPEVGGGSFLSDTSPEEKAAELRALPAVHYKRATEPVAPLAPAPRPAAARTGDPRERMSDVSEFIALLRAPQSPLRDFFAPQRPVTIARAPGRLDVMGGIADYSGSLVLQLPLGEATLVAMQPSDDGDVRVVSLAADAGQEARTFTLRRAEAEALLAGGYGAARQWFGRDPATAWAAYVVGALLVLAGERGARFGHGLRILVRSHVPEAKGVSSSAALEVATMQAAAHLLGTPVEGAELARLCQVAENCVVGAPCGIMDQMTAALGRADHLLALLCQPAEVRGFLSLPPGLDFWGIDSGIRHAVSGSDYTAVRAGAFMGYRIIADLAGLRPLDPGPGGSLRFDDPLWKGYLANLTPQEFAELYAERLPEALRGEEFLRRYGGSTDAVARIDPGRTYAVRQPTAHPIYEHARLRRFARLLFGSPDEAGLREMGGLMYAAHASYSACGLGSAGTDRLVELVREAGEAAGLYGAKITGGGSGGTVAVLGRAGAAPAVATVASRYAQETGREAAVFAGSSSGACHFGVLTLVC